MDNGDLERFLEEHGTEVKKIVYYLARIRQIGSNPVSGFDREDVLSEIYLKLAKSNFDPSRPDWRSWIYRVTQNFCTDYNKKRFNENKAILGFTLKSYSHIYEEVNPRDPFDDEDLFDTIPSPHSGRAEMLWDDAENIAREVLSPEYAEYFVYAHLEGHTKEETGEHFCVPPGTAGGYMARSRKQFTEHVLGLG